MFVQLSGIYLPHTFQMPISQLFLLTRLPISAVVERISFKKKTRVVQLSALHMSCNHVPTTIHCHCHVTLSLIVQSFAYLLDWQTIWQMATILWHLLQQCLRHACDAVQAWLLLCADLQAPQICCFLPLVRIWPARSM